MRPKKCEAPNGDLFHAALDAIINLEHARSAEHAEFARSLQVLIHHSTSYFRQIKDVQGPAGWQNQCLEPAGLSLAFAASLSGLHSAQWAACRKQQRLVANALRPRFVERSINNLHAPPGPKPTD